MTLANTSKCIICPPRHTQHKYAFDKCGPSTTVCRKFWNTLHGGFPARLGRHDPVGYEWTKTSPSCRHRLGGPLKHSPDPVYHYRSLWKIFASPTCFLSDRRCGELFRLLTVYVSFFSCWLYLSPSLLFCCSCDLLKISVLSTAVYREREYGMPNIDHITHLVSTDL